MLRVDYLLLKSDATWWGEAVTLKVVTHLVGLCALVYTSDTVIANINLLNLI